MIDIHYHPEWQKNRLKFIIELYGESFFKGKNILELGPYNGYIGYVFDQLGANVHLVEGRAENIHYINYAYPNLSVELGDVDTPEWKWGKWDIIINFGLYYHLENHHKEHMENCLSNSDIMFFESVIFDSYENEIVFNKECGGDQSLTDIGGTPSTSYVENLFKTFNRKFTKYTSNTLNGNGHVYDWIDANTKIYNQMTRRLWIVE